MSDVAEVEDSRTASIGQKRSRLEEDLPHGSASTTSRDVKRVKLDHNADFVSLEDGPEELNTKSDSELPFSTNGMQRISESQSPLPDYVSADEDEDLGDLQVHLTEEAQINPGPEPDVPSLDRSQSAPVEDQQLGWEVCLEPTPSLAKLAPTRNDSLPSQNPTTEHNVDSGTEAPPRVLSSLSEDERRYQQRYWGLTEDYALARCPVCSVEGHIDDACPARRCRHCGVQDDHFSIACPLNLKCKRCRERGHSIQNCLSKLARSNADGFSCDLCRQRGHTEEDCSLIWRTFDPDRLFEIKKVDRLVVSCYECGSDRHWGNDCLIRPRKKKTNCDVFSAAYANRYLSRPMEPPAAKGGFSVKGRANQHVKFPSNDNDDDPSAFYHKKPSGLPPKPLPHGNINIKTLSFGQRQGDGGNSQLSRQGSEATRANRGLKEQRPNGGGRSNWQPPLPREPLPQRPAIPPSPQRKHKRPPPEPVPANSFRPRR